MSPVQIDYRRPWRWDAGAQRAMRSSVPLRRVHMVKMDGSTLHILVRGTTVLSAKLRVWQRTGIAPCNMRLLWEDRLLDDSEAIPPRAGPARPLHLLVRTQRHGLR